MPNKRNNRRSIARRQQDQRRLAALYRHKHEAMALDASPKPESQAAAKQGAA